MRQLNNSFESHDIELKEYLQTYHCKHAKNIWKHDIGSLYNKSNQVSCHAKSHKQKLHFDS